MVGLGRQIFSYTVDAHDEIRDVNSNWLAFAAENNARQLSKQAVLGHSLWEYVAGDETIHLYQSVLGRVRRTRREVLLPFRCDSPTLERHMRMVIVPEPSSSIRFDCVIEKVRATSELNLLNPSYRRSPVQLNMCSCCKRILVAPLGWLDVAEAVARLNLFDTEQVPHLQQIVCPACRDRAESCGPSRASATQ